jgi:hypothetical protein
LIEGYKSRSEEDLEIANEFFWVDNEADDIIGLSIDSLTL